jgi:hypothetical protein
MFLWYMILFWYPPQYLSGIFISILRKKCGSPIKVMMEEIKIFNARFAREKKGKVVQISGEVSSDIKFKSIDAT